MGWGGGGGWEGRLFRLCGLGGTASDEIMVKQVCFHIVQLAGFLFVSHTGAVRPQGSSVCLLLLTS